VGEDRSPTRRRVTVAEAAEALGITVEAVRGRIKRGTLEAEREGDHVFVLLEADQSRPAVDQPTDQTRPDALLEALDEARDQIRYLRELLQAEREARTEEARRHDTLMAQLMQRIPEIEAPERPSEASQTAAEEPTAEQQRPLQSVWQSLREEPERAEPRTTTQGAQEAPERPWWRRVFGG
jgi:hypothetical protein